MWLDSSIGVRTRSEGIHSEGHSCTWGLSRRNRERSHYVQIDQFAKVKKKKNKKFKQSAVQTQMNFKVLPQGQIPKKESRSFQEVEVEPLAFLLTINTVLKVSKV